jgi:hypothetical protein
MGQAVYETVPQFMPFMIVCPVSIEVMVPSRRLICRHAADSGSTAITVAGWGFVVDL